MARVPVIDSPCPITSKPLPAGATEHCTLCDRTVHNLDRMSEHQRRDFLRSCSGKVCVAYTVKLPIRPRGRLRGLMAVSLAASAAALMVMPASAADPEAAGAAPPAGAMSPLPGAAPKLPNCDSFYEDIIVGGVSHGDQAEWADDGKDAPPDLPTMEDDGR
jgi:hypothetical protein